MEIFLRVLGVLPRIFFSYELILALLLVIPFVLVFRPKLRFILLGMAAFVLALVFEALVSSVPIYIISILLAPMIEESVKFILAKGKKGAIGVGLGFATVENASYFLFFGLSPLFVIMRAIGDPMLHSFSTSIAVKTKEGKWWGLPVAILIHSSYNTIGIILSGLSQFYFIVITGFVFFGVLFFWNSRRERFRVRTGMEVMK